MPNINQSYQWAINTCNTPNVGYSQPYRNQKTVNGITYYDCSSFIWYALQAGGFDVETAYRIATGQVYSGNAITTASERAWLLALGFTEQPISGEWKAGDILWRSGHTEMVYSGGIGSGVTMGAHSANYPLDRQVSINSSTSSASSWTSLWRYGGGGATSGVSIYVISAICGNWRQESNINPGLWQNQHAGTWTDLNKGYGLGQWTNTGGDTHGRLYQLHQWLSSHNYADDDGDAQIQYLIVEGTWYQQGEATLFSSLNDFLASDSTDIELLTHAYNIGWEGIHDASWDDRVTYARWAYDYILAHKDDASITTWITGNRYLTLSEIGNNAVMAYRALSGTIPPSPPVPPTPTGFGHRMPVWMMLKYH